MSNPDGSGYDRKKMKNLRRKRPSAWLKLTDNQTLPLVIDALIDAPPGKEFNKKELGDYSGVSRESIREHIDVLLEFGVLKEVSNSSPTRYRLNDSGKVTVELFELNSALNAVGSGGSKNVSEEKKQPLEFPVTGTEIVEKPEQNRKPDDLMDNSRSSSDEGSVFDSPPEVPANAD